MDPDATLEALINAACAGEATQVQRLADALTEWIRKDGHLPLDPREIARESGRRQGRRPY